MEVHRIIKASEEKQQRKDASTQNKELIELVQRQHNKILTYETIKDIKPFKIESTSSGGKHEATVLTLLSDIHYEERITRGSTNGLNEYSPEIANRRIQKYFVNLLKLVENNRNDVKIDNLVLGLLGDNLHGFIHDEYISNNWMTPIQATEAVTEQLLSGFQFILDHGKFKKIIVVCKVGNHSRTTDKVYSDTELVNSYEYMVYKNLARNFRSVKHIEFQIDEGYFSYVTIYDKVVRFEHGHAFKYAGGIGGIYVPLIRHLLRGNKTKPFDLAVIGHWHSFESISTALINGCVCGYNAYAIRKGFEYQPPVQQFQLVDSKYGFTVNSKIFLEEV
jgi:rhodanese-related sulfurtransferase